MAIQPGGTVPSHRLKRLGDSGIEEVTTEQLFKGRKVVLFGVPGAFTPTCTKEHMPGYVENAAELKSKGIDEIVCVSVNDPFVMKAWSDATGATDKVTVVADWNAEFVEALDLAFDGSGAGLGKRSKRFSMIVEDSVVKKVDVEENPGAMVVSGAATCLTNLG